MYYENHPIRSELKSKRVKWVEPVGPIAWSGVKSIREHNSTKRIYEVDPYVEVYQYRENIFSLYTENADGMQDMWMHLIIGPERAMLIDTGYGIGNTKGLVDFLTGGKPTIVVNTHSHCDHAYGNCRFERVYCHEFDVPELNKQDEHMWDYLYDEKGEGIWLSFDKADLPKFKEYEIIPVKDGHIFDLGNGCEVELILLGGHTPGHSAFLDKQNRILFSGDDVSAQRVMVGGLTPKANAPYGEYSTLLFFYKRLKLLTERISEFDYIFPGHLMLELESHIILSMCDTCEKIVRDNEYYHYFTVQTTPQGVKRKVYNTFVPDVGMRIGFTD